MQYALKWVGIFGHAQMLIPLREKQALRRVAHEGADPAAVLSICRSGVHFAPPRSIMRWLDTETNCLWVVQYSSRAPVVWEDYGSGGAWFKAATSELKLLFPAQLHMQRIVDDLHAVDDAMGWPTEGHLMWPSSSLARHIERLAGEGVTGFQTTRFWRRGGKGVPHIAENDIGLKAAIDANLTLQRALATLCNEGDGRTVASYIQLEGKASAIQFATAVDIRKQHMQAARRIPFPVPGDGAFIYLDKDYIPEEGS